MPIGIIEKRRPTLETLEFEERLSALEEMIGDKLISVCCVIN